MREGDAPAKVLEAIARGAPLDEVLTALVEMVEQQAPGMLGSVLLLGPDARLRRGVAPHLPEAYSRAIDGVPIGPCAGSCGTAAFTGQRVIVEDIATDPLWADYRAVALENGLRACWSTPVLSPSQQVVGTFALYYREPRRPDEDELRLVEQAGDWAALAIAHERARAALAERQAAALRAARLHALAGAVSEALRRARPLVERYAEVCRAVVEVGGARLAWMGPADGSVRWAQHGALEFLAALDAHEVRAGSWGPTVRALAELQAPPLRAAAGEHGLRATVHLPLALREGPAVLAVYADPELFGPEELGLWRAIATHVETATAAARAEAERDALAAARAKRVRELTSIHELAQRLARSHTVNEALLREIVALAPSAWEHPEHCVVRLRWRGLDVRSLAWREPIVEHSAAISTAAGAGALEVGYLDSAPTRAFLPEEEALLRSLAELMAADFGRAEAEAGLREREERLWILHTLAETLRGAVSADAVLPATLTVLGHHLRATRCICAELSADGERCRVLAAYGGAPGGALGGAPGVARRPPELGLPPGLSGARSTVVIRDAARELPADEAAALAAAGVAAHVSRARPGSPAVVVSIAQSTPRDWTPGELALVEDVLERAWATYDQRLVEERLRQNEALLKVASAAARIGGWRLDVATREILWSDEACALHDLPPGAVPSRDEAVAMVAPEHRAAVVQQMGAAIREGRPMDFEYPVVTAAGRRVWIRTTAQVERDAQGHVVRVHGAMQDIDARRRLEEQLRQAQKMEAVGVLAGGVAHDFNNLLSVILSYTSLALDGLEPDHPVRRDLEDIRVAGERAADLTRQLLAFSRHQVLQPRVLDLREVLERMERLLARLVGEAVTLTVHCAPDLGRVYADPSQLEQIILNIASNARDAIRNGGTLSIEATNAVGAPEAGVTQGDFVRLSLRDDGAGMSAATRDRIFEPFFSTKERGKGTGLGLATVFGVVKQSGGHITVDSELGRGTTVRVYLPRTTREADTPTPPPPRPNADEVRGTETVLVAEDEDQVRAMVRSVLAKQGYRVLDASDGLAALALAEREPAPIALLLTDVVMPRMNGRELAERLIEARPSTRVLYMSGYTEEAIGHHGVLEPGIAFLQKPITPDVLVRAVRAALDGEPA